MSRVSGFGFRVSGFLLCACLIGLTGCGTPPSTSDAGGQADAAETPLPQRVLSRPTPTTPAPPPDYSVIGERNVFQPKLLTRRRKPRGRGEGKAFTPSPLHPFTPSPLPPLSASRAPEVHPLTGWRVVGVLITDERQAAWLEDAQHQTVWVEVGTTIADGHQVVAIAPTGVMVRGKDGQEVVLQGQGRLGQGATLPTAESARTGQPFEKRIQGQPAVREP